MRIRTKLLILLLVTALLPLGFISAFEYRSLRRLGRELGTHTRETLIERAGRQLTQLADDYGAILRREREIIELVLRAQAREVERCYADPDPAPAPVYWDTDYDDGPGPPEGLVLSTKHYRRVAGGEPQPIPVTYDQQVAKLAPGVTREDVADDIRRLAHMPPAYRFLQQGNEELIFWQYTATLSGLHTSYPGHGGYPANYDPRSRLWFETALQAGELIWNPPIVGASTEEVLLTTSMPVRHPDGTIVGVTAIDVRLLDVVQSVKAPFAWSADAETLIVRAEQRADNGEDGIVIDAQKRYRQEQRVWNAPIELEWLESSSAAGMRRLVKDVRDRQSGLRQMQYRGRDSLWAYSPIDDNSSHLLLIVPYDEIIAQARAAEQNVLDRTSRQLRTTVVTLVTVSLIVLLVALSGSRTVTRPVADLARAAKRVASGDFDARTSVASRDELGELGHTFNRMVPQLADRMRLRESLSLAMEVQQRLLPSDPPAIDGLDVAGRIIYSDETGGDYFDFLELAEMNGQKLGVAVGDVTGHGIAAALLMTTGRALLRSRADHPGSLGEVMSDINRLLVPDTGGYRFMTMVYLIVDVDRRSVRWVSAGHDPPITFDIESKQFGELVGGGIPLGIVGAWQFKESEKPIAAGGQIIVIGTDGIWEARNPAGEMFGKDALRDVIRDHAHESAEQIIEAVTTTLTAYRQTRGQEDDITLVVLKMSPGGQRATRRPGN